MSLALGLGLALPFGQVGGPAFSPEALALFARFTTPPTEARKILINNLIVSLISAGVWTKLDALYLLAAADNQAARRNWIADQYNLTAVSAPTFTADRGYAGDGSGARLESGFNPTTAVSPKFTQDSATMGLWSRTNVNNGGATAFEIGGGTTASYLGRNDIASGRAVGRVNTNSGIQVADAAFPGHAAWSRSAAAIWEGYAQGVDGGGGTTASVAPANAPFCVCAASSGAPGVNQIASAYWGSNLTAPETLATYNALNTYLTAVGAA